MKVIGEESAETLPRWLLYFFCWPALGLGIWVYCSSPLFQGASNPIPVGLKAAVPYLLAFGSFDVTLIIYSLLPPGPNRIADFCSIFSVVLAIAYGSVGIMVAA